MQLVSPPRHPLWLALIQRLIDAYDPRCYEPTNTGPGGVTVALSSLCSKSWLRAATFGGVTGGHDASIAVHQGTGSWREIGPAARFKTKAESMAHYQRVCPKMAKMEWAALDRACVKLL